MASDPVIIPEKIYFKIGEVCDLLGVQPHVLRYWETEFPMLSPQKNKSGQRSYRRRDVEMALKIKQLLYNEMFTIAGARKKLQSDARNRSVQEKAPTPPTDTASSPSPATPPSKPSRPGGSVFAPMLFDTSPEPDGDQRSTEVVFHKSDSDDGKHREVLRTVSAQLLELREMLKNPPL